MLVDCSESIDSRAVSCSAGSSCMPCLCSLFYILLPGLRRDTSKSGCVSRLVPVGVAAQVLLELARENREAGKIGSQR